MIVADCSGHTAMAAARPPRAGLVRIGFYEVEATIGKGNYALVKLARHRVTKTEVIGTEMQTPPRVGVTARRDELSQGAVDERCPRRPLPLCLLIRAFEVGLQKGQRPPWLFRSSDDDDAACNLMRAVSQRGVSGTCVTGACVHSSHWNGSLDYLH